VAWTAEATAQLVSARALLPIFLLLPQINFHKLSGLLLTAWVFASIRILVLLIRSAIGLIEMVHIA
jgi:hypothetical protein